MNIRTFVPKDHAEVKAVILAGLKEHFGYLDKSLNPDLSDILSYYINNGNLFFVAEDSGKIIGTAALVFKNSETAEIVRMSVLMKYRRKGVAGSLLNKCISEARIRGIKELIAFTEPHWIDAVSFYLSQGFIQFGSDDIDIHLKLDLC